MVDLDAATEWVQCDICLRWIHSHCANYMDQEVYICMPVCVCQKKVFSISVHMMSFSKLDGEFH